MARQYSPLAVLRHLPADLVRRFCEVAGVPLAVGWDDSPDVPTLYAAWLTLPPDSQKRFEQMLQWVHQLGTGPGVRALAEEAVYRNEAFAGLPDEYGHPATALWCLIH